MPNNFYQSTYKYEGLIDGWKKDRQIEYDIINELTESAESTYKIATGINYIITKHKDTLYDPIGNYEEDKAYIENGKVKFKLLLPIKHDLVTSLIFMFDENEDRYHETNYDTRDTDRRLDIDTVTDTSYKRTIASIDYNIWDLFPYRISKAEAKANRIWIPKNSINTYGHIVVSQELQKKINFLSLGLNIDYSKGDYGKMFYLSAVTITTLGFGDIVPISEKARLWISSEAILGIVLIGLFLNSLANKIKR